jgi:DNA-binding transcriptional regulator YiaG
MENGYRYLESGLDSVFLVNGFEFHDGPRGRTVTIHDIDGLHRAIGLALVRRRQRLTGKEFRYLRSEMLLSQASLGHVLGVKELTVARWEKGQSEIPLATDAVVRQMYLECIGKDHPPVREILERIADLDDALDRAVWLKKPEKPKKEWQVVQPAAAA